MRYIWDSFDLYFRRMQTSHLQRLGGEAMRPYLREWDKSAPSQYTFSATVILSKNSGYYDRESQVVYPPVDLEPFTAGQ